MIINFENYTYELTEEEKPLTLFVANLFLLCTKDKPILAPEVVKQVNDYIQKNNLNINFSEPRLRKMVNFIRTNGILPLIARSKGYYVSYNLKEIENQIQSLKQRANSINNCAYGLEYFLINNQLKLF